MNIIQTKNLTKSFGDTIAINNVSINVREGEIYGFLGLNGAGKTTAIRLMLGMIFPDTGSVSLFNHNVHKAYQDWNNIGYMVETPYSYPNLSVYENLEVICRLRGLSDRTLIDKIIITLQLSSYKHKKAKQLSLGNNQRLGLAKALIHSPKLLLLDEPINGLDPAGIVEIRGFLKDLVKNHNTTIFISSHILSEISKIATRIGIIHNGTLIKEIDTAELENQTIKKVCINTSDNPTALKVLSNVGVTSSISTENIIETSNMDSIRNPENITQLLTSKGLPPKSIYIYEEDLERYFLRIIDNNKKDYETTI